MVNTMPENNLVQDPVLTSDHDIKSIVDMSPYPIFIHRGGIIKYANELVSKLVHVSTRQDIIGINLAKYIYPEDHLQLKAAIERVHASRATDTHQFRIVDTEGNIRQMNSKSSGVSFEGELCRIVYVYNYDQIKHAEEDILQKNILIDTLIEVLPDSLVVLNSATRKQLYNNRSFVKTLGYEPEDYEGSDESELIRSKIHPDDLHRILASRDFVSDAANTGKLFTTEYRILNKAGEWRWILSRSCSLMPAENGIGRINFGMAQDITEIKANQNELLNYKAFQEKINNTSAVLVTVFDIANMTSIYRSQNMAERFEYPEKDFPAQTIELIHPDYREEAVESIMNVTKMQDGEIQSTVYPFVTGDGGVRFILTRSTVFQRDETGQVTHILTAHSDITDLKEIESRLDKSEESRRAILDAIPDMVITAREDGLITDFYPNGLNRLEFEGVDFLGMNVREILSEKYYVPLMDLISKTIKENRLHTYTFDQVRPDRTYTFELRIAPFSANEVIVLTRDISDQKANQNKIDHYNQELYKKNQELERYITSNSELEKFAYIASHDLREPLRSLTGFAQLLQKRNQGVLSKESEEFIENIIQGAQRMNTLVSGLLEYSRITSAGKPFTKVNLSDLIKKVRSDLKISIEENKAELILFDLPDIYCDELQIRQLFQNLISNAIKFRSEKAPIIKIFAEKEERHWLFKIEDNGIGIDMKFKDQVFQIFSRLHAQDKYQGSGIGLSVCKKILERHGGQIWLESTPGIGTTILFTILI
jgi:PAS domain S-box-containing protein